MKSGARGDGSDAGEEDDPGSPEEGGKLTVRRRSPEDFAIGLGAAGVEAMEFVHDLL